MADQELAQFVFIEASPERVWAALTDPAELVQWLTETCTVDLEAHLFTLHSGTPGVSGAHRVIEVAPARRLGLAWQVGEQETRVTYELTAQEGGTRVVTRHVIPEDLVAISPDHVHELWAYNNSLLKMYLELGEAKCRLASDRAPERAIRHQMTLSVPPEAVFAALTEPERIRRWNAWAPNARCDGRVGGTYSFGWSAEASGTDGPHEIVEWEPGRRLTYRWYGDPPTLVRWEIEPLEGAEHGTRLTLVHSGFGVDQNMLVDYNLGWADFLACLAIDLERGVPAGWSGVHSEATP